MEVFIGLKKLPKRFKGSVVTLGVFDGVHRAHQKIISTAVADARKNNAPALCISFDPHPRTIKTGVDEGSVRVLTTMKEKIRYLENLNLDGVLFLDITDKFLNLRAEEFIEKILHNKMNTSEIVVGYNYRFGKGREGDTNLLEKMGKKFNYKTKVVDSFKIDGNIVSSTLIRELIREGNIEKANKMLGKPYCIIGHVGRGDQIGRQIGFATANVMVRDSDKLLPGNGVYFTEITFEGERHFGICNVGVRPTFGENQKEIEVHILGLDKKDLYDKEVRLQFHERMRDEEKYDSVELLVEQIKKDKEEGLKKISKYEMEDN